jgi:hypothetical protein
VQRAHRDGVHGRARQKLAEFVLNPLEHVLVEVHQIHLVDREDEVGDAEQPRDPRVALRLRSHAVARIDEEDRHICRRGARGHVARVLFMAGRIRQDELAASGREVPIRDVDGDALFALGPEPVGEQREIDRPGIAVLRGLLDRRDLILVDGLRVVQQSPDQRALAVVHAPRRADPKKARLHQK